MLKPKRYDRDGPVFDADDIHKMVVSRIKHENYFIGRVKRVSKDLEEAKEMVDDAVKAFSRSIDELSKTEQGISEKTKKVSGQVRDAAQKLSDGLAKIEKVANFDRLERYIELLERAEKSMTTLADLHDSGKLDKIAAALK